MQFTAEDLELPETMTELVQFLPIVVFIGLVAPFLIAAYTAGFFMDLFHWIDTD